ncbi:MAG: DMT family transporter [Promethearchaeota archaeon]
MVEILTRIFGIILALSATFLINIGVVLQKKDFKEGLSELNLAKGISGFISTFKNYLKNKSWAIDITLGMIGWVPYIIAQGMIGILAVQPIQEVGLIIPVIVAYKMLNEKIRFIEVIDNLMWRY